MRIFFYVIYYILLGLAILCGLWGFFIHCWVYKIRSKEIRDYDLMHREAPSNLIFVAYRAVDERLAVRVRELLESQGLLVHMWNPQKPFSDPVAEIFGFIELASVFTLIKPDEESQWLRGEIDLANRLHKPIIEVREESDVCNVIQVVGVDSHKRPRSHIAPWIRHEVLRETLEGRVDSESWSKARIPRDDVVGEDTAPGMLMACLFYGAAFGLGILTFIARWIGSKFS